MKRTIVCAAAALPSLVTMPVLAQEAITTPILNSVDNFRDLAGLAASKGGTGYAYTTSHDGVMRTGVFFRSNALVLSDPDFATVSNQNISTVIDLRTPGEIAKAPDRLWPDVEYFHNNVSGSDDSGTPSFKTPEEAIALLEGANRTFVTDGRTRNVIRDVLLELAYADNAALYHCTAGKDRTGWISAVMHSIAGVSQDEIMKDYLASNTYSADRIKASLDAIAKAAGGGAAGEYARAIYAPLMGVQASFLQAGLDQVATSYDSMDAYLKQGLGLSQADIYVLRAKMVYYQTLPGENDLSGNSAAGATLLKILQNSSLSGHYTDYNYYLQSAIDAGTLGGVEAQIGGQVHADAGAYLLRMPSQLNAAISSNTSGTGMEAGQTTFWQTTFGESARNSSDDDAAKSTERTVMPIFGATHRIDERASVYAALGYGGAQIESASGKVDLDGFLAAAGGRYALNSLETGPYVAGGIVANLFDYDSERSLGGLGIARGNADGTVFDAHVELGHVIRSGIWSFTPEIGIGATSAKRDAFTESDSDLGLNVEEFDETAVRLTTGIEIGLDHQKIGDWSISTSARLGYERLLSEPEATSHASIQGFAINQDSAFNSKNLGRLALNVALQRDALTVKAGINGAIGDGRSSDSIGGQVSLGYKF